MEYFIFGKRQMEGVLTRDYFLLCYTFPHPNEVPNVTLTNNRNRTIWFNVVWSSFVLLLPRLFLPSCCLRLSFGSQIHYIELILFKVIANVNLNFNFLFSFLSLIIIELSLLYLCFLSFMSNDLLLSLSSSIFIFTAPPDYHSFS